MTGLLCDAEPRELCCIVYCVLRAEGNLKLLQILTISVHLYRTEFHIDVFTRNETHSDQFSTLVYISVHLMIAADLCRIRSQIFAV